MISVIVPVYQVEKYLTDCVHSILNQTFQDIELILVDDGSPDQCGKMCDNFAMMDKRVKVIHKLNGGLSDARNAGIEVAKGDYLTFIDSDDFVEKDMLKSLHSKVLEVNGEIAACCLYNYFDETKQRIPQAKEGQNFVITGEEAVRMLLESKVLFGYSCGKLYHKSIFSTIRFPIGKHYEDAFIILKLFAQAKIVYVTTDAKYYYRQRQGSITNQGFNPGDMDHVEAFAQNVNYIQQTYPQYIKQAECRLYWVKLHVLDKMLRTPKAEEIAQYKPLLDVVKQDFWGMMGNPHLSWKRKIGVLTLRIHPKLYQRFVLPHVKE